MEIRHQNVTCLQHPLMTHKLTILRNKETGKKECRELVIEIADRLCWEATKDAVLDPVKIETPVGAMETQILDENQYAFYEIWRAGEYMKPGVLRVLPNACIGSVGMYRGDDLTPTEYYFKPPQNPDKRTNIIIDPMCATGGSAIDAINLLKQKCKAQKIKFICIFTVPEALNALWDAHPDVPVYCAVIDEKLNEHGYIVPGMGDAGDRLAGTP